MPYSTPYSTILNLLGSRSAHEIDDASREARAGLDERFRDIIYNVEADPWKVKVPGVTLTGEQSHMLPATPMAIQSTGTREVDGIKPVAAGGNTTVYFPIIAPQGSKITNFQVTGYRTHAGASVVADLIKVADGLASVMATISITAVAPTPGFAISGVLDIAMASDSFYIAVAVHSDASDIDSAKICEATYTVKLAGTF